MNRNNENRSLKSSFSYALKGLIEIYKSQRNFRIQSLIGLIVLIVAIFANLTEVEFILLIFTVMLVLIMETVNTVAEKLLDFLHPFYSSSVKIIKDVSAASVFITSIFAVAIGIIIFGHSFFNLSPKYGIILAIVFLLFLNLCGFIYKKREK
jgi:diacylglycerol kinase (ATP)